MSNLPPPGQTPPGRVPPYAPPPVPPWQQVPGGYPPAAPGGAPKRSRVPIVIAIVLAVALVGGATLLLLTRGEDTLDTESAAATVGDAIDGAEGAELDCPIDDLDGLLGEFVEPVGNDELYDVVDTGELSTSVGPFGEVERGSCARTLADSTEQIFGVSVSMAETPSDGVVDEYLRGRGGDATEVDELDELRGGTLYSMSIEAGEYDGTELSEAVAFGWSDGHMTVIASVAGDGSLDLDDEALREGFETMLPNLIDDLAGDGEGS